MNRNFDISVIIATYNRDSILNQTLSHMALLDRCGLSVEFVVVDNNSTDYTEQVIKGFSGRLPIRYLFEPKPGQNSARNLALAEAELGEIIVFTDDDIKPAKNWFKAISSVSRRRNECNIFGGRIYPIWPQGNLPKWTRIRFIQELGFAAHDYDNNECFYSRGEYPSSGNFWVRRKVFEDGRRFDVAIEWSSENQIMATETMFLRKLTEQGEKILHCPDAVVGHKVTAEQLTAAYLIKRAYSWGRGMAHIRSLCRPELFRKSPALWRFARMGAVVRDGFNVATSLVPLAFKRPVKAMHAMQWMGYNIELLNITGDYKRQ